MADGIPWKDFRRHSCIIQTEGYKHCTPIAVRITVPFTIAGVAIFYFIAVLILGYFVIVCALCIAKLSFSDCQYVLSIKSGQFRIGKGVFPVRRRLQISLRIGVTSQRMCMLFFKPANIFNFIALISMSMVIAFICTAFQIFRNTFFAVAMFFNSAICNCAGSFSRQMKRPSYYYCDNQRQRRENDFCSSAHDQVMLCIAKILFFKVFHLSTLPPPKFKI